jgi:hypothetical protein
MLYSKGGIVSLRPISANGYRASKPAVESPLDEKIIGI